MFFFAEFMVHPIAADATVLGTINVMLGDFHIRARKDLASRFRGVVGRLQSP